MSIVRAKSLSKAEMSLLGNNVYPMVESDRCGEELAAVNRSLILHDEFVDELICTLDSQDPRRIA